MIEPDENRFDLGVDDQKMGLRDITLTVPVEVALSECTVCDSLLTRNRASFPEYSKHMDPAASDSA